MPRWKGYIVSKESRNKILETRKRLFKEGKIIHPRGMLGKSHIVTDETREKIRKHHNSRSNLNLVRNFWKGKKRGYNWANGKKFSEEHKEKIKFSNIGKHLKEKNSNWKGGISPLRAIIYGSLEFKQWRKAVFERDNFTHQKCGQIGGILHAHHIKPFSKFPELRFDVNNGRTLCRDCHKKTPTYGNFLFTNKSYMVMLK